MTKKDPKNTNYKGWWGLVGDGNDKSILVPRYSFAHKVHPSGIPLAEISQRKKNDADVAMADKLRAFVKEVNEICGNPLGEKDEVVKSLEDYLDNEKNKVLKELLGEGKASNIYDFISGMQYSMQSKPLIEVDAQAQAKAAQVFLNCVGIEDAVDSQARTITWISSPLANHTGQQRLFFFQRLMLERSDERLQALSEAPVRTKDNNEERQEKEVARKKSQEYLQQVAGVLDGEIEDSVIAETLLLKFAEYRRAILD